MLAASTLWHQVNVYVSTFLLQVAVYVRDPAFLRYLCHPGKVVQARTNSISVWKAIYKPAFSGTTLLIRLGEGWGRERCSFHKTIDMHFSKSCFSFTLCQKRLLDKAEIWVSLQQERKTKELHPCCLQDPRPGSDPEHNFLQGSLAAMCPRTR